ncbi:MAG: enoyl-CoA hydratase-related protein [Pseudomonadota bacterium]
MDDAGLSAVEPAVLTTREGAVLTATMNRPARLNAFNTAMHEALSNAVAEARDDKSIRVFVLTGAGRAFSAGQDLSDSTMGENDAEPDLGHTLDTRYNPLVRSIRCLPIPTVAAINGVAAGAALNIALICDIAVAARSAAFLQPFANLGLVPDAGGTFTLPRLVGLGRARALALLAEKIDADTAERWGLIYKVFDDDAFAAETAKITTRLASLPTDGLAAIKRAFDEAETNSLTAQLDAERDAQRLAGQHPDYREGVSAFIEKRKPNFVGRR